MVVQEDEASVQEDDKKIVERDHHHPCANLMMRIQMELVEAESEGK